MTKDKFEIPKYHINRLVDWLLGRGLMSDGFAVDVRKKVKLCQFMKVETFQLEDLFEIEFRSSKSANSGLVFKVFRAHQSMVHVDVFFSDINIPREFRQAIITSDSEQLEILHIVRRILDLAHEPKLAKYFEHWESAMHRHRFLSSNGGSK